MTQEQGIRYVVQFKRKEADAWRDAQEFTTFERAEAVAEDAERWRLRSAKFWRVIER